MKVSCALFQEFYDIWYDTLFRKEYGGVYPFEMGERSPALLTYKPRYATEYLTTKKFRGGRSYKPDYFYTKKIELNPDNKDEGMIDSLAFFKGLEYIDFYKPEDPVKWSKLKWRQKLPLLYDAFEKEHPVPDKKGKDDTPRPSATTPSQDGYHISKLDVFKNDVRRIAAAGRGELYTGVKRELLSFFSQIETEFPHLTQDEFPILTLDDEQIAIYQVDNALRELLYKYILDDTKSKEKRKKALAVFCYHKGLSDAQIVKLFKSKEQGISRLALERLCELVTAKNDKALLCSEAVSFAAECKDVGIARRVGELLYAVDFSNALTEIPRLFPAAEVGLPKHTIEGLWNFISLNPKVLKTQLIAKQALHLATICLNYDPAHQKLNDNFTKIKQLIAIRFPVLVQG